MKTILITLMLMVSQAAFCQQMYDRSGSLIGSTRNVPDHIVALVYFYGIFPLR